MDSIVVFTLGFGALIVIVISIWYLIQTVRVMWTYNSLLAIAAIFFSPLIHIAFYFMPKDGFDKYERGLFKKYFLSIGAIAVLGVVASIVIPAIEPQYQADAINNDADSSQPWNWDIRAENQEEVLALAEANPDDKAAKLHFEAIYQAHPDADSVMESPEFEAWLQGQPAGKQDDATRALREGTAAEVIYVFSNFKQDLENYRAYEYQARRENAQALAQTQYQERQNRELETIKSNNQRSADQQRKQEIAEYVAANRADQQPTVQQAPTKRGLSYSERQEREELKALLSKPHKGMNGELTRSQKEALVALQTGQPMPSHSQNTGGSVPTPTPTPSNMASCDGAGCWDTSGTRYNKGAGDTYFPSTGGVCQNIGGQMQCN